VASARRIWDSKHGEEMGIEILLVQKLILKKSKKRYFSEWSREGIEKVLRTMIILNH
jgi:hypothetical protein